MSNAITIHQPYASLIVSGVKMIETRPAPAFPVPGVRKLPGCTLNRGDRVLIHASAQRSAGRCPCGRWMDWVDDCWHCPRCGDEFHVTSDVDPHPDAIWPPLPLGAIVGSAVLLDCVPIEDIRALDDPRHVQPSDASLKCGIVVYAFDDDQQLLLCNRHESPTIDTDITDQMPLGDFRQGRWAWLLGDAAPVEERCPACWALPDRVGTSAIMRHVDCPVFHRGMKPIHMKGKQGIWQVTW